MRLALILSAALILPVAHADGHQKDGKRPSRASAADSAVVIVLCEDGGKSPAGRTMEAVGRRLLEPFVTPYYSHRTWLTGADATRKAFLDAVGDAARAKPNVDVVLFLHGTKNKTHFGDGYLTGRQLASGLKSRLRGDDVKTSRLRMVYTTACYSQTVLDDWAQVAYACRGMSGVNRPLDFPAFWLSWITGADYRTANARGMALNARLHARINKARPKLVARLTSIRERLETNWKPTDAEGKRAKATIEDLLRLVIEKWLNKDWDVEESRPRILGADARHGGKTPAKLGKRAHDKEDGKLGERVYY